MFKTLVFQVFLTLAAIAVHAADQPNILLIVADDMGYGDLSCQGSKQVLTPNLDRLAAQGIRCTAGYVSNNVCAPSRAGFLTGRSGCRFGFEHNLTSWDYLKPEFTGIPLDETLISDRLQDLGYRTGIVGKWHLGEMVPEQHPNARGFDFFFGMLGGDHAYFPKLNKNRLFYNHEKAEEIRTPYLTDWFTLEAIDFINGERKARTNDSEKPWFLYLSYNSPHGPLQAKEADLAKYSHIKNKRRQTYCAMQSCMDENIGKILDELKKNGQLENTLIAFISDNGGSVEVSHAVNAPLRGSKGTYFEGGIRVPTIYFWEGKLKPGVYTEPVSSLDFMATFVNSAGGAAPPAGTKSKDKKIYDSVDLIPYFNGSKTGTPHDFLYWRTVSRGSAVRMGDWKLLQPSSQPVQLFNLKDDPGETHDLAAAQPAIVRQLLNQKVTWESSLERPPMFSSGMGYTQYARRLYDRKYLQTQPAPDFEEDVWSLDKN